MDAPEEFLASVCKAWWGWDNLGMDLFGMEVWLIHSDGSDVLGNVVGAGVCYTWVSVFCEMADGAIDTHKLFN